jgi:NAD(P)-dependent dehydrogenase (short-subunit alcohol dehydrogenase family)
MTKCTPAGGGSLLVRAKTVSCLERNMSKLKNKIAVISGGTTGIGLATAQRFVTEGAHVFIFGRRQAQRDEAAKRIEHNVTAIQADAANLDDLDRVAAAVRDEKGAVASFSC